MTRPAHATPETIAAEKRAAAEKSLEFIRDGMELGLGTGSTAAIMIELLGERVQQGLRVRGVPTSVRTHQLAEIAGIPLIDFDTVTQLDLTIDGADEIDPQLNLIKGGGAALLREKIVASASRRLVIIADSKKLVERLGAFPLPVEVIPFACRIVAARLTDRGLMPTLRTTAFDQPLVTDEGNYILDCACGEISDPAALALELSQIPGVVEHGLFVGMADTVVIGRGGSVEVLTAH